MRILARDVAAFVAAKHGMTFEGLCAPRRVRHVARPRQIAMYAIRRLCPHMSYPTIARILHKKDHTTVMHGVRKVESLIQTDYEVARVVADALAYFRPVEEPAPIAAAVQFQVLCSQYGQAMRAAA